MAAKKSRSSKKAEPRVSEQGPLAELDAIVDEVRAIRSQLWNAGGGTVEGYLREVGRKESGASRAKESGRPPVRRKTRGDQAA
ncbi:MAG: hypothetical protein R3B68_13760 [Phycisphaerales bacterium]